MLDNKLGEIISKLRREKGLTQKDLADELHISDKAISRWETGKSAPNLETIYAISKYFKINFKDLLEARVNNEADDNLVQEIVNEFTEMNSKNTKRIKNVLLGTLLVIFILIIVIIFTNTFNRFKVYKVGVENSDFSAVNGVYVETNVKDSLYLSNINIKGVEIKNTDTVSVDLYFLEDGKENIIHNFSNLDNIHLDSYQSYIEIDNLSDYFDKMYLRVIIIDKNNKVQEYKTKLIFVKDFSNNTLYIKDEEDMDNFNRFVTINKSPDEIQNILLENGFEKKNQDNYVKENKKETIKYILKVNKLVYLADSENLNYKYTYNLNNGELEIYIYDHNNLEIENYKYDSFNDKVIECMTGSCNDYKDILNELYNEVLYLLN